VSAGKDPGDLLDGFVNDRSCDGPGYIAIEMAKLKSIHQEARDGILGSGKCRPITFGQLRVASSKGWNGHPFDVEEVTAVGVALSRSFQHSVVKTIVRVWCWSAESHESTPCAVTWRVE